MAEITAIFNTKEEPTVEKRNEELRWYDVIKKEMVILHGGKLSFEYKKDDYLVKMGAEERRNRGIIGVYRMLPKAVDVEIKNYNKISKTTNQKEIENWFYSSAYINDISVDGTTEDGIIFNVPDEEIDDFSYQLERQGFNYRI